MWRAQNLNFKIVAKNLTSESLNLLLARFSEDERQAAVVYKTLRDSLVRFFELKGDSEPEAAADETLDRTALKVAADTPIDNITKYSFGVARLIFLERLRLSQKEKKAAEDFYTGKEVSLIDAENDDFRFFRECFDGLPTAERMFLQSYFTDAPYQQIIETRRRLTVEAGVSINQIRVKVSRLRKRLENCVQIRRKNN
jgi:DNA-directed RNA polymerase specialized sigma24 family protein